VMHMNNPESPTHLKTPYDRFVTPSARSSQLAECNISPPALVLGTTLIGSSQFSVL
jgi:hypothetical protein